MEGTKSILLSVTFWGLVLSLAGMLLPSMGVPWSADDSQAATTTVNTGLEFVGLIIAFVGRMRAKTQVTIKGGAKAALILALILPMAGCFLTVGGPQKIVIEQGQAAYDQGDQCLDYRDRTEVAYSLMKSEEDKAWVRKNINPRLNEIMPLALDLNREIQTWEAAQKLAVKRLSVPARVMELKAEIEPLLKALKPLVEEAERRAQQ